MPPRRRLQPRPPTVESDTFNRTRNESMNPRGWRKIGLHGLLAASLVAWLLTSQPLQAHPMGNFAICHYTRLQPNAGNLRLRYILDLAEIPTFAEKALLDRNRDGVISAEEKAAYLDRKTPELLAGLSLIVGEQAVPLRQATGEVRLSPGAGGLNTLQIMLDIEAALPSLTGPCQVVFRDRNYEARAGWKEIIAVAGPGVVLRNSSVPAIDRSRELTDYPPDQVPPQD